MNNKLRITLSLVLAMMLVMGGVASAATMAFYDLTDNVSYYESMTNKEQDNLVSAYLKGNNLAKMVGNKLVKYSDYRTEVLKVILNAIENEGKTQNQAVQELEQKLPQIINSLDKAIIEIDNTYFDEIFVTFENTINNQAKNTNPKDKLTVKFNKDSKVVNMNILSSFKTEGISAINRETGLNTAITNILQSNKVTKLTSSGYVVNTLDVNGVKKDSATLQGEALGLALSWLGNKKLDTPVNEFLIGNSFEFILYGELKDGKEFSTTYNLIFK